jgi:hypothetical protein
MASLRRQTCSTFLAGLESQVTANVQAGHALLPIPLIKFIRNTWHAFWDKFRNVAMVSWTIFKFSIEIVICKGKNNHDGLVPIIQV